MIRHRLTVISVLLLAGACTSPKPAPTAPATASPSPTTSGDVQLAALRRPWAHPAIAPGAPCPVTTAVGRPDPNLGPMLGDGPARPVGLATGAVLDYLPPQERSDWTDKTWGGQKVLWAVEPAVSGPVLVRGRQIDGPGSLAFEDPAMPELVLNMGPYEGQPGGWKDIPGLTRVRAPGCYASRILRCPSRRP